MNKLIIALMATAFAGSVMAAEPARTSAQTEGPSAHATAENPVYASKKTHHKQVKKSSSMNGMNTPPAKK